MNLVDELERAHQDVKRQYLVWAARRPELRNGGVGAENNRATATFIRENCQGLQPCLSLLEEIRKRAEALDLRDRYEVMRELFVVHPSLHELWDFDGHAGYHRDGILGNRYQGMGALLKKLKAGDGVGAIRPASVFLAREAIMLENLYSSRLAGSLLDAPLLDDKRLVSEMETAVATWGPLSVIAFAEKVPAFLSIVHTLLERTGYYGLEWGRVFKNNDWMVGYAPCAVNEGPVFTRIASRSRLEILKGLPALDQASIHDHLLTHFDVTLEDYEKDKGTTMANHQPNTEASTMSVTKDPVALYLSETVKAPGSDPAEHAAAAGLICMWAKKKNLQFELSPGNHLYIGPPNQSGKLDKFIRLRWEGYLAIDMHHLKKLEPFEDESKRQEYLDKLNSKHGLDFGLNGREGFPSVMLKSIADPDTIKWITDVFDEMLTEIR